MKMNARLISIFYLFVHLLSFFSFRMSVISLGVGARAGAIITLF